MFILLLYTMPDAYQSTRKCLVQALEHVEVMNSTDICHLEVDGLTEIARLIAILDRRVNRLCFNKLAHAETVAKMTEGQRLLGKDVKASASYAAWHEAWLAKQRSLEKYARNVKT